MRENQLPVHHEAAEEPGRVRPAVDFDDGGVHIQSEPVADLAVRPVGNYLADDLTNSVQITMAHCSAAGSASKAPAVVVAPRALPGARNHDLADDPERQSKSEERDSKSEKWLLAAAVISVTTLFTTLSTLSNPERVPSFVAQTVKISKQLSTQIKKKVRTAFGGAVVVRNTGGTAGADSAKTGAGMVSGAAGIHGVTTGFDSAIPVQQKDGTAVSGVASNSVGQGVSPAAPASLTDADRSPARHIDSASGAHRTIPSGVDETGAHHNSPVFEMPKVAEAKFSKSNKGFLVPPPPPTPYVLPSALGFFPMQSAQQYAAAQQQLQQVQAEASFKTHNQTDASENMPHKTGTASGRTEAAQSAALGDADQELQSALKSSLHTVGEWTR